MDVVKHASVTDFSVNSITSLVPAGYNQVLVDDVVTGVQPLNTYILGLLQDSFEKVIRKGIVKKRLILREVQLDGTEGNQLDVIVYGTYAHKIEDILKTLSSFPKQWVIFTKTSIVTYPGSAAGNGWCMNCLRVGGTGMTEAQVIFVTEVDPHTQNPPKVQGISTTFASPDRGMPSQLTIPDLRSTHTGTSSVSQSTRMPVNSTTMPVRHRMNKKNSSYENINSLTIGKKFNLFVVVNEIVKPPTLTARQSHHMLLGLIDPSCLQPGSQRPDLLLHIFINDKVSNRPLGDLPGGIASGDVIRIKDMFTELYQMENKVHGKVYSAGQIVKFSFENDTVTPITYSTSYDFTDEDCNIAIQLKQWWNQVKHQLQGQVDHGQNPNAENEFDCVEATIKEVNCEMYFSLFCQVLEMRPVSKLNKEIVILRVRDGTLTSVHTQQCNIADATQDLLSQTDQYSGIGSKVVDINVLSPTEDAKLLESGDFALLKYVNCVHMNPEDQTEGHPPLFELLMNDPRCVIKKISTSHSETRKIIRRLGCSNPSEAITDALESTNQGNRVPAGRSTPLSRSPLKPSPNRINTQPLSPQRLHKAKTNLGSSFAQPSTPSRLSQGITGSPISQGSRNMSAHSSPHLAMHTDSLEQAMEGFQTQSDIGSEHRSLGCKSQSPRLMHPIQALDQDISRIDFPADLPTSTQRMSSDVHTKGGCGSGDGSGYSATQEDLGLPPISPSLSIASNDHRTTDIRRISSTLSSNANEKYGGASSVKRRLPMIEEMSENSCQRRVVQKLARKSVVTECSGDLISSSLSDIQSDKQTGVIYKVTAMMKSLYISPDGDVCQTCDGKLCLHNWVWGLCVKCGKTLSSSTLRNFFSERDLASLTALPCVFCIESHTKRKTRVKTKEKHPKETNSGSRMTLRRRGKKESPQRNNQGEHTPDSQDGASSGLSEEGENPAQNEPVASSQCNTKASTSTADQAEVTENNENMEVDPPATVAPFIRLKICLSDPKDGSEIDVLLNGDNAKHFFGLEPTFEWTVRRPERKIVSLICALLREKNPLDFAINTIRNGNGRKIFIICNTVLKLKD